MATLTVIDVGDGIDARMDASWQAASAGGDEFEHSSTTVLFVANSSGGARVLTIASQRPDEYGKTPSYEVTIPNGQQYVFGLFSRWRFADGEGRVQVSVDSAGGVLYVPIRFAEVKR